MRQLEGTRFFTTHLDHFEANGFDWQSYTAMYHVLVFLAKIFFFQFTLHINVSEPAIDESTVY